MGSITRLNAREAGWHCKLSAGWLPLAPRCWYLHHNLQIRTVALLATNNETPSSYLILEGKENCRQSANHVSHAHQFIIAAAALVASSPPSLQRNGEELPDMIDWIKVIIKCIYLGVPSARSIKPKHLPDKGKVPVLDFLAAALESVEYERALTRGLVSGCRIAGLVPVQ